MGPRLLSKEDTAAALIPEKRSLRTLKQAASGCKACPLWQRGRQTVFGEGLIQSRLMLVGEQPGNDEDMQGKPFVGPAGRVLNQALQKAGIDRRDTYVTNVVKHFKWIPKGKLRMHQKPNAREIGACLPWLDAEIDLIQPELILALGATAAQALFGKHVRVTRDRGRLLSSQRAPNAMVTIHPSAILRASSPEDRQRALEDFIGDLRLVTDMLYRGGLRRS